MLRFGILTTALPAQGSFNSRSADYIPRFTWRVFHKAGVQHGIQVLFFRSQDVEFQKNRVHAWSCTSADGLSGWKRSYHPLPDVIYDCYYMKTAQSDPTFRKTKKECIRQGIPVFNPALVNKAKLYRLLQSDETIKKYIPDSKPVKNAREVLDFFESHQTIYLKPVTGTNGKGILEVKLLDTNQVAVRAEKLHHDKRLIRTFSLPQFKRFINVQLGRQKYLAQEGLNLLHQGKRKIDFRVIVHRDSSGRWHSIGVRPKLGQEDAIVTNTHAGGEKTTWNELIRWARTENIAIPVRNELEAPAILAARRLTAIRPELSHLGIDVAVCRDGKIYILDINSRPGRDLLTSEMLVQYARDIVGFASFLLRPKGRSPMKSEPFTGPRANEHGVYGTHP